MPNGSARILIVAPGGIGDRGGIGRLVTSVIQGWETSGAAPRYQVVDPYGPKILAIAPFYFAWALLRIVWYASRGEIRLLHVHMADKGSAVRKGIIVYLGKWLSVPVILHLHAANLHGFVGWLPAIGRGLFVHMLARADLVVVLGEFWRRLVVEELSVPVERVRILHNAVYGPPEIPVRDAAGPCRLVFLGRIDASKGLPELLEALASERLVGLDWQARVAGLGAIETFQRRAAALGLADRVRISDWVPEHEARRLLAEADVFVLPSHHEGLSMAMLEALAFGLAVIATPVGATEEAVVDGVSGLLVPPGDVAALAEALARVISDRRLRERLQREARRRFEEHFEVTQHCRSLESLYAEVGAGPRGTGSTDRADAVGATF